MIKVLTHQFPIICFMLLSQFPLAWANPPLKIDQIEPIGRLTFFRNNTDFSYYLPAAFHSELECLPQGSNKTRCLLRIINDLNKDEIQKLHEAGSSTALSHLSYNIVNNIHENFELQPELINPSTEKVIYTKTLMLSEAPYVIASFILENQQKDQFMEAYQNSKVGVYKVKVDLVATETKFYLSLKDTKELRKRLLKLEGKKIKPLSLSSIIKKILSDLKIDSQGFEDPIGQLAEILQLKYFEKIDASKYRILIDEVNAIQDGGELFLDDTTHNNPYFCEITLDLKLNALPTTRCAMKGQ